MDSGSGSKLNIEAEIDMAASIPFDGDSIKKLNDDKWGQSMFGPSLRINYLKTP